MNPGLTKNYTTDEAIGAHLIVKAGSADFYIGLADAATDAIIGVSELGGTAAGDNIDIIHGGIATVKLGGTVSRGDYITATTNGLGVAAAPSAGTNNQVVGKALQAGVTGDEIDVLINIQQIQG